MCTMKCLPGEGSTPSTWLPTLVVLGYQGGGVGGGSSERGGLGRATSSVIDNETPNKRKRGRLHIEEERAEEKEMNVRC